MGSRLAPAFVCATVRRSPAPLCDPRRCARGAGEDAGREGAEGGAPSSEAGPALPPIGWTLPPSGGRRENCRAESRAAGRKALPGNPADYSSAPLPRGQALTL